MKYNEEDIQRFMESFMKEDDTFKFECKMCGDCCRSREESIMLTGYDIFKVSKALDLEPVKFINKYTEWYIGSSSNLPVVILKERQDGSCPLLRKGKCMVQEDKPIVCAIYPLGRMFIAGEEEDFGYFQQPFSCGFKNGKEHTLKEWLDKFKVYDWDEASILWAKTIARCAMAMQDTHQDTPLFAGILSVLLNVFYIAYDIEKDYLEQFKSNIQKMETIFKELEIEL
jgi:hypothetical protein